MAGRVHGLWDNHIVSFRLPKGRVEGRGNMALEDEATWKVWSRRPDRQLLEDMGFKWPTAGLLQMAIWEEMKEYGVDQNTNSSNSLLNGRLRSTTAQRLCRTIPRACLSFWL